MLEKGKDRRPVNGDDIGHSRTDCTSKSTRKNRKHSIEFTLLPVPFFIGCMIGSFIGTILVKILTHGS
ncbi:MAG: hypothetical protein HFF11_02825 [Angelakisella sp.]|nr:hypothetical protein [Angelakisella sp.]